VARYQKRALARWRVGEWQARWMRKCARGFMFMGREEEEGEEGRGDGGGGSGDLNAPVLVRRAAWRAAAVIGVAVASPATVVVVVGIADSYRNSCTNCSKKKPSSSSELSFNVSKAKARIEGWGK